MKHRGSVLSPHRRPATVIKTNVAVSRGWEHRDKEPFGSHASEAPPAWGGTAGSRRSCTGKINRRREELRRCALERRAGYSRTVTVRLASLRTEAAWPIGVGAYRYSTISWPSGLTCRSPTKWPMLSNFQGAGEAVWLTTFYFTRFFVPVVVYVSPRCLHGGYPVGRWCKEDPVLRLRLLQQCPAGSLQLAPLPPIGGPVRKAADREGATPHPLNRSSRRAIQVVHGDSRGSAPGDA